MVRWRRRAAAFIVGGSRSELKDYSKVEEGCHGDTWIHQ
jgi:hypothetical protein